MPAVSVVPMPASSWSDTDFSRTASLAPSIASRKRLARRDGGTQRFQRGGARDLAGAVAAHAVGDGDQAEAVGLVDEVVLVAVADTADVGDAGGHQLEPAHLVTSATVWPNCTRSPRLSRVAPVICLPFTKVPLVEPRSST